MLIMLVAPHAGDHYYAKLYQDIVDFQVAYAKKALKYDDVRIIAYGESLKNYRQKLPPEILIDYPVDDIWVRDFGTVNPNQPCLFRYTAASMSKIQSQRVQKSLRNFLDEVGFSYACSELLIDGGNVVDNYQGKCIVTERVLEDNRLTQKEAIESLKMDLNCQHVAIIPSDEPVLAHADGMLSWIDDNLLAINDYRVDSAFREDVLHALYDELADFDFIEIPFYESDNGWPGFSSACGIYANAVLSEKVLYVPQFGHALDEKITAQLQEYTNKIVVTIDAQAVCKMGGSVRCLSWQLAGESKEKILLL